MPPRNKRTAGRGGDECSCLQWREFGCRQSPCLRPLGSWGGARVGVWGGRSGLAVCTPPTQPRTAGLHRTFKTMRDYSRAHELLNGGCSVPSESLIPKLQLICTEEGLSGITWEIGGGLFRITLEIRGGLFGITWEIGGGGGCLESLWKLGGGGCCAVSILRGENSRGRPHSC